MLPEVTESLYALPCGPNYNLVIVPVNLNNPDSILEMAQILCLKHEISQINVAVANAGICDYYGPLVEMTDYDLWIYLEVNTFRLLSLFRGLLPFLRESRHQPKFVYVLTELASLARLEQNRASLTNIYSMSNAAGNYMIRRLYFKHEELTIFAVNPR